MDTAAFLSAVHRCGAAGAYVVVYPEGYAILWLPSTPSEAVFTAVERLLPPAGCHRLVRAVPLRARLNGVRRHVGWSFPLAAGEGV